MSSIGTKVKYFAWAAARYHRADRSCPACGHIETLPLQRKAIVTELVECVSCSLRFRVPKDSAQSNAVFYKNSYREGITTDCPDQSQLQLLLQHDFQGSEKDFASYLDVLRRIGIEPGSTVLDYGSSWGYGSWQLRRAGFRVYSYEINERRAEYAREYLECDTLATPDSCPEKVDVFFSAHVIEHLPNPNILWAIVQQVLKPSGTVVLFMPNGDPKLESVENSNYHLRWGKVHPLLLSDKALNHMARKHGFAGHAYSSPYDMDEIGAETQGDLTGDELLYIAKRMN